VAAKVPGLAEQAETELYRRFAPRMRLYGLRHLLTMTEGNVRVIRHRAIGKLRTRMTASGTVQ
jgi:hypothetical protein